jgi:hypothetical protein
LTQAVLSAERAGRARTTRASPSDASSDAFPPRGERTADRRGEGPMNATRAWVLAFAVACSSSPMEHMEPFSPFQPPTWAARPDDDAIAHAIVGRGGTADERADAESIARDLLVPVLRARPDVAATH